MTDRYDYPEWGEEPPRNRFVEAVQVFCIWGALLAFVVGVVLWVGWRFGV